MNDLRHALRRLRREPGFTATVVLTLALGIGATTVVFSAVNALLLRPLPVEAPDRLVTITEIRQSGRTVNALSLPEYLAYREEGAALSRLAAHGLDDATLTTSGGATVTLATYVSGNYFDVLGVRPAAGRFFDEEEARGPGAAPVAVASWDLWQRELGGSVDAVGQSVRVNGQPVTIVGVAPRGFHGAFVGARPPVWLPLGLYADLNPGTDPYAWDGMGWLLMFGRLAPGTERPQAEAALTLAARRLAERHQYFRDDIPVAARLGTFSAIPPGMREAVVRFMALLLATAGLVLLIAIVNVTGMFLARVADRRREAGIRAALGAGRWRLARQWLAEGVAVSLLGGAGSVFLGLWIAGVLQRVRPPFAGPFTLDLTPDVRVAAFAGLTALGVGALCGLVPAIRGSRSQVLSGLRLGRIVSESPDRLRAGLVGGQIAITVVLLVAAGLFLRTLAAASATDHGFDPRGVTSMELNVRLVGYEEDRGRAFHTELLERMAAAPDVEAAAFSSVIPLGFSWNEQSIRLPGHEPPPGEPGFAIGYSVVSPEYFRTLRLPVLAGRAFTEEDGDGARVLVVNRTFQERFWPGESAIGRTVPWSGEEARIVGVVADGKYRTFDEGPRPYAYVPLAQHYVPRVWLHVRAVGGSAAAVSAVRRELAAMDPDIAPISTAPLAELLEASLFPQKLAASFVGTFGGLGLVLAMVGVFGILSHRVVRRRREFGVRMALGARGSDVLAMVVGDGFRLLAFGTAAGLVAAWAVTRLIASLLHGVSPTDPATYLAAATLLAGVGLLAASVPAFRATRVEPMEVLRHE